MKWLLSFAMRWPLGAICALALAVVGCSESPGDDGNGGIGGDGGTAGNGGVAGDRYPGNCGNQGAGGGAAQLRSGLYQRGWNDSASTYQACVHLNEDCTELEASTRCDLSEDTVEAKFLELEWTDGRTDAGEVCSGAVSLAADRVDNVPITGCGEWHCTSFRVEFLDEGGVEWLIGGNWSYNNLFVYAERRTEGAVCRTHVDYPSTEECWLVFGPDSSLCLINDGL